MAAGLIFAVSRDAAFRYHHNCSSYLVDVEMNRILEDWPNVEAICGHYMDDH